MSTIPDESGFWAHGRLAPYNATRFNVQNVEVVDFVWVEVFADGVAVWSKSSATLARSNTEARDFMSLIVAAYTIRTGIALDFIFTGWIEATKATFEGTIVGFVVPRGHRARMDPNSRRSDDMRAAIALAATAHDQGPWRLAIRDVHAAYQALAARSDDAFVFAYRAVEDLAHAVSPTAAKDWAALQRHLGTTESVLKRRTKRLRDARDAVVHGDANHAALVAARKTPARLVGVGRSMVREAIGGSSLPTI